MPGAAAVAIATLDVTPDDVRDYLSGPQELLQEGRQGLPGAPFLMLVTQAAAERLLGASFAGSPTVGTAGRTVDADLRVSEGATAAPARNVVAVLRGSDAKLQGEYVAIGRVAGE